ncbi:MAG: SRPBCC family protein [Fimbriimonadaceae bacterium]|nr:SRPBCC family protein [Fimbriimonadaceae bacterium]
MVTRVYETVIDAPVQAVAEFHQSVEALKELTPPGARVEIISEEVEVREGALHVLRIHQGPFTFLWKARISDVSDRGFMDVAEKSPFKFWRHRHEWFDHDGKTVLRDTVTYEAPGGMFVEKLIVNRLVDQMFAHRHAVTKAGLERPTLPVEQQAVQPHDEAL